MPVKYQCPRCEKRFVEWGAEKLGFKCPDCDGEELVRLGVREDQILQPPKLKRRPKGVGRMEDEEFALVGMEFDSEEEEDVEEIGVPELGIASDDVDVSLVGDYEEVPAADEEDIEIKEDVVGEEIIEELAPDVEFENSGAPPFDGEIEDFGEEE